MIVRATIPQKALAIILNAILLLAVLSPISEFSYPQQTDNTGATEPADPQEQQQEEQPSPTPDANAPRQMIDIQAKATKLLMQAVEKDNVQWLNAMDEKFMALWQLDKTDNPFGAVVILHGEGQSAEWPNTVSAIRNNLSEFGWSTLAISLPPPGKLTIPKRPEKKLPLPATETNTDTEEQDTSEDKPTDKKQMDATATDEANKEAMAALEKDTMMESSNIETMENNSTMMKKDKPDPELSSNARISTSIQFLNEKGQYNIVIIGHGIGAIRAAKFIQMLAPNASSADAAQAAADEVPYKIRALIMVAARNQILNTEEKLIPYLKDIPIPILDIYYSDHYLDNTEVKIRRQKLARINTKNYYQVKLMRPNEADSRAENRLTRRIRGFLNKHAKGVEVER